MNHEPGMNGRFRLHTVSVWQDARISSTIENLDVIDMKLKTLLLLWLSCFLLPAFAGDTTPRAQFDYWSAQAGQPGNAQQGALFFNNTHAGQWSCASCHGTPPLAQGKHASTSKLIKPLAPAANPQAFTDAAKIEKWFRRNCKDVLERECSPAEKADVLAYLLSLKL